MRHLKRLNKYFRLWKWNVFITRRVSLKLSKLCRQLRNIGAFINQVFLANENYVGIIIQRVFHFVCLIIFTLSINSIVQNAFGKILIYGKESKHSELKPELKGKTAEENGISCTLRLRHKILFTVSISSDKLSLPLSTSQGNWSYK